MLPPVPRTGAIQNCLDQAKECELIVKDHAQEAAIDSQSAFIIVDEAILSEPVHEMTYP